MSAPISRESGDWLPLKSWLITRIHELQRQLEEPDLTVPERGHDVTRGKIAAFRQIINTVEPAVRLAAEKLEEPTLDSRSGY